MLRIPRIRMRFGIKLFLSHLAAVLIVSGSVGTFFYIHAMDSGMLPICCSCKKIRNDQGYWQRVEQFVELHTSARFTHGLCPECAVRLYGDILSKPET